MCGVGRVGGDVWSVGGGVWSVPCRSGQVEEVCRALKEGVISIPSVGVWVEEECGRTGAGGGRGRMEESGM